MADSIDMNVGMVAPPGPSPAPPAAAPSPAPAAVAAPAAYVPPAAPQAYTPPAPTPPAAPPPAPAPAPQQSGAGAFALDPEQDVAIPDQWGQSATIKAKHLMAAHAEMQQVKATGYDLYLRGMQGDQAAAQEYLRRIAPMAMSRTAPAAHQAPQQQPQQPAIDPQQFKDLKDYVDQQRTAQVRSALEEIVRRPDYSALQLKPGAVDEVLTDVLAYYRQHGGIEPGKVHEIVRARNQREAEYQAQIRAPLESMIGEMGVSDPFRGDTASVYVGQQRPNPVRDPQGWKKYIGAGWAHTLRTARQREASLGLG